MGRLDSEEIRPAVGRPPRPALESWSEIARQIRGAARVALLSDFDGSLAAIRLNPERVRLSRVTRRTLRRLAAAGVLTGIISGRALRDVQRRVGLPALWYAGSHGLALAAPGRARQYLATPAQRRRGRELAALLQGLRGGRRGIQVERKDGSLAVHYRRAALADRVWLHRTLACTLAARDGSRPALELRPGLCVWEVMPRAPHSKWTAIQRILRQAGFAPGGLLIYMGDDVADEDVFRRMRRQPRQAGQFLPVLVGAARPSGARYRLRNVGEAREFLRRLAEVWP